MNNVVAIIQARMGSSRFPDKILKEICGQPMLGWVIKRTAMSKLIDNVVIATTLDPTDEIIEDFCLQKNIACFRGSSDDVLDRFHQAAKSNKADTIVRITADCPFIDAGLIDQVVLAFQKEGVDFAANRLPPPFKRTFPIGLDVEVVSFSALERAWQEASKKYEREHVMPYFYEVQGRFRIRILDYPEDLSFHRWTVDTPQDLEFISQIAQKLDCRQNFNWLEVLTLLQREPELMKINAQVKHKTYKDVDSRIKQKKL